MTTSLLSTPYPDPLSRTPLSSILFHVLPCVSITPPFLAPRFTYSCVHFPTPTPTPLFFPPYSTSTSTSHSLSLNPVYLAHIPLIILPFSILYPYLDLNTPLLPLCPLLPFSPSLIPISDP